MNQIWQDINPLQTAVQGGVFNEHSLLGRSLRHALTPEQAALYEASVRERQAFRQRARVEQAVATLEQYVPLTDAKRGEVIERLAGLTKLSGGSGTNPSFQLLMYQMSQLPVDKVKPIFDEAQWRVVSTLLAQYRGSGRWLKQSGQLPNDDDDEKPDGKEEPAWKKALKQLGE
jgi:hypothetical protein